MSQSQHKEGVLAQLYQRMEQQRVSRADRKSYCRLRGAFLYMMNKTRSFKAFHELPQMLSGFVTINNLGTMTAIGYEQFVYDPRQIHTARLTTANKSDVALAYLLRPLMRADITREWPFSLSKMRRMFGSGAARLLGELAQEPKRDDFISLSAWATQRSAWARRLSPDAKEVLLWEATAVAEHMKVCADSAKMPLPQQEKWFQESGLFSLASALADVNPKMASRIHGLHTRVFMTQMGPMRPLLSQTTGREHE